jgi:ATP-dependent RNA helicase DeaD
MSLANLETLVFDEADRMLSMGFYPDMLAVKRYLPGSQCGFMFSATYPQTVRSLASQFLRKPGFLSLSLDQVHVSDTQHVYYETPAMEKDRCLVRILEAENPESAIIFCNTKVKVNYVATVLARYGYDSDQISADLTQKDRERVLEKLRRKALRFLVATDVAGRGIDIPRMSHVIIYDFPDDQESYIHRAGRTGRAGASGTAITLANEIEKSELLRLGKRFGIEFERRPLPTDADLTNLLLDRLTLELEAHLRRRDNLQIERIERMMPVVNALCERDGEPLVLAMLLYDFHQGLLKKAPEVPALPPPAREPEPASKAAPEKHPKGGNGGREELRTDAKPVEPKTRSEESPKASGGKADGPVPGGRAGRRNEPKVTSAEAVKPAAEPVTAAAPVVAKAAKPAAPASAPMSERPLASGTMARRPVKSLAARRQEAAAAQVAAPVSLPVPAAPEKPKAPEPKPTATAKATAKPRAKTDLAKAQPVKVDPAKAEPVIAAPVAEAPAPVKAGSKAASTTKPKKPASAKVQEPKAPEPPAAKPAKQEKPAGGKSAKTSAPAKVAGKASASTGKLAEKPAGASAAAKAPVKAAKKPAAPAAAVAKATPAKVKKKAG